MEPSDCEEAPPLVDVWRSATMQSGAQCVMTSGALKMLKWCADSWDMNQQVCTLKKCSVTHLLVCRRAYRPAKRGEGMQLRICL